MTNSQWSVGDWSDSVFVRVHSVVVRVRSIFVRVRWWACVVVRGRSFPLVGMRPRPWAFVFVRGPSFSFMGGRLCSCVCVSVSWCAVGRLVDPRGPSWCSRVVDGGVSSVFVGHVTWASLLMLEKEVGGWGYGTHLHAQWRRHVSSSLCAGLVMWHHGVVVVWTGVVVCRGLCDVDGGWEGRWLWATGGAACRGW